ncbi:TonB-dependent siderophore receptor [Dyella tabacisoli]|uniref:TonB-dependent siderophore receptor n=2 Tax=Dyella tabacisoli TaxID=2282381 RepID=A0A369URQ0_9GAMM|nr:TonB-dependent siderophore receptor [Dyella tabacisoli]
MPVRTASAALPIHFAIPPQALSTALIAFGKQANVQVLTAGGTIEAFHSGGVNGSLSADAALVSLLQGSGLSYEFVDAGTVVVRPLAPIPAGSSHTALAAPAGAAIADAKLLAPVHSQGLVGRDIGYMADVSSSATRTDSALIDVPQSISIVTRDLMDSQQILTVADAVRNVAGVQAIDGSAGVPLFQIRGFYTGSGMTDGMPNSFTGSSDFPPLIGVERVEVLKGPQSVLGDYSVNNNFGGLINVVMKQPQSEPVRQLSYAVGERGDTQIGVDLAGPLTGSKSLTYRLVLSGEYADRTTQGYYGQRNSYFAPSIGWQDEKTKIVVGGARIINRLPIPDHTILLDSSVDSATPAGLLLGNPSDHATYQTSRFYYLFEHRFNNDWTFRSHGQYVSQTISQQNWTLSNAMPSGDVNAMAEVYRYSDAYYTLQNDIVGIFQHGMLTHRVVLGFDYARSHVGSSDDFLDTSAGFAHNVFTSEPLPSAKSVIQPSNDFHTPGSPWSTNSGLFLQDQIAIGEYWDVLLALRRWSYELSTDDINGNAWTLHKTQWVPNVGVVYKATPEISLFASTASGFQPDTLLGQNGQPLMPAFSRQLEAGAKFDLFQHQARLTASAYRIMLDRSVDVLSVQPPFFAMPGPGQTNEGLEVEFTGRVAPGMDISASYTNAHIRNHDGSLPTGASRQRFNLWASYWFQGEALHGWGVAAGVLARSHSLGQISDDSAYFNIPGQARVDANVSYRAKHWGVTLGIKNLFGRNLYSDLFDERFVSLHNRRTYMLTGTYDF